MLDQLSGLEGLACRAMFGGWGLYCENIFFGILHKGRLYFKTDASSRRQYRAMGMQPFRPNAKQTLSSYYEVPVEIVEDCDRLHIWAARAAGSARRTARRTSNGRH